MLKRKRFSVSTSQLVPATNRTRVQGVSASCDDQGNIYSTWRRARNVYYRVTSPSAMGELITLEGTISKGLRPVISVSKELVIIAASWSKNKSSEGKVFLQALTPDGQRIDEFESTCETIAGLEFPSIAFASQTSATLASTGNSKIILQQISAD